MKITAILLQQTQTRPSMVPNSSKITENRENSERKREKEKKRLVVAFCF